MKEIRVKLNGSFAWKFINIPDIEDGCWISDERKKNLQNDFNIGFDKTNRREFLRHLHRIIYGQNIFLNFELKEVKLDAPHHLDRRIECIDFDKKSFKNLIIQKNRKGKEIEQIGNDLILSFGKEEIYHFFVSMYTSFELYAPREGNTVKMKNSETNSFVRLVIWGVHENNPIYY